jgi:hypothetical protein
MVLFIPISGFYKKSRFLKLAQFEPNIYFSSLLELWTTWCALCYIAVFRGDLMIYWGQNHYFPINAWATCNSILPNYWTTKLTAVNVQRARLIELSALLLAAQSVARASRGERARCTDLAKGVFGVKAGHRLLIMLSYLHTLIIASRLRVKPPRSHSRAAPSFAALLLTDAALCLSAAFVGFFFRTHTQVRVL